MKKLNVIFIGEQFYKDSDSMMSSLYKETGERYDYGFLQRDLANGYKVNIRQATPSELVFYTNILKSQYKERT